jgi:3-hydroxyacyl-CoA dehydrogenase/enoyl-CoA hydratase/3-hydroxybutyryl-CoA epimerase
MSAPSITTTLVPEGVLIATIDMPGRSMNVFSNDLMDSLESLLDQVAQRTEIRSVVITSGKAAFLAGADLEMVKGYTEMAVRASEVELHQTCGRLGRLFLRLQTLGKPFVAAINGLALGGGLELALACQERIVADGADVQLGLPEIKLGLLPGAGGTQRLPRYIGTAEAFVLLLKGDPVSAQRALELGLVNAVVRQDELLPRARSRAQELAEQYRTDPAHQSTRQPAQNPFDFTAGDVAIQIARHVGLTDADLTHYPAYRAIIDCVVGGWPKGIAAACEWEMQCFVQLIQNPVAGNMIRTLFLNRQRAAKLLPQARPSAPFPVAVLGPHEGAARRQLSGRGIAIVDPVELPQGGLLLTTDPTAARWANFVEVAWLRDSHQTLDAFDLDAGIWISDSSIHGRVVEVCVRKPGGAAAKSALQLAAALRATPLVTPGESLLQLLKGAYDASADRAGTDEQLLTVALAAAHAWSVGSVPDVALADTATVIAGYHPAYSGGPFTYLRQRHASDLRHAVACANAHRRLPIAIPPGFDGLCLSAAETG